MSFQVSQWPRPDDLARYHEQLGVPPEAIIRDIVRIVCVAQLVHDGVLDEDWVLSGGMGMRLRGSSRFTMSDTDTSRRGGAPDRDELAEALTVDQEELLVTPVDATLWKPGKKLVSAHPIDYEAFFADVGGGPIVNAFKFTVSWRGLFEPPDKLAMLHPYPRAHLPTNRRARHEPHRAGGGEDSRLVRARSHQALRRRSLDLPLPARPCQHPHAARSHRTQAGYRPSALPRPVRRLLRPEVDLRPPVLPRPPSPTAGRQ